MMEKIKYYLITFIAGIIIGIGSWAYFSPKNTEIKIIKESPTKSEYIKPDVSDYAGLQDCYKSPIEIFGKMNQNSLYVVASDKCKKSAKNFELGCKSIPKKNIIQMNYVRIYNKKNWIQSFGIAYYRELFANIALGCGLIIQKNDSFLFGYQIGLQYRW